MISLKVLELSHWQIDRQSETWTQWLHTLLDIMMVSRDLLWELNATLRVFAWNRTRILCITAAQQVKSIHQTQCMPTVHTLSALSHSVINFHHFTHKYTTINLQQEHPQRTMTFLVYSVSHNPPPWNFLTFFSKRLEIFSPNFAHLLYVPIYAGLQIFIQLPATLTKLCHIKHQIIYIL